MLEQPYANNKYEVSIAEVDVQFSAIEKMEEKASNFKQESRAIHEAAVKEWDRLYEALKAIAEKYKDSPVFQDSQLYRRYFERATGVDVKVAEK